MQETLSSKRARHVSAKKLEEESFDATMLAVKKDNKKKCQVCAIFSVVFCLN